MVINIAHFWAELSIAQRCVFIASQAAVSAITYAVAVVALG